MNKYLKTSLIIITAFIASFYCYYELFNQFLQSPTNSLEASNTTIQFILLVTGIITIVFLYINYQQQKNHIKVQQIELESNRKDVEFNRAIDLIYKQLEYTGDRYNSINLVNIKKEFNSLVIAMEKYMKENETQYYSVYLAVNFQRINAIYLFLANELTIYQEIIEYVDSNHQNKLIKTIAMNIDASLIYYLKVVKYMSQFIDSNSEMNEKYPKEFDELKKNIGIVNGFFSYVE